MVGERLSGNYFKVFGSPCQDFNFYSELGCSSFPLEWFGVGPVLGTLIQGIGGTEERKE